MENLIYFNGYLFGSSFFFTVVRNVKNAHPGQRTLQIYLLCLKVKVSQSFKSSSYKKPFLHCSWYLYNLLRWMFLIPLDNWKAFLFINVCCCPEFFSTGMLLPSLKKVFWKKSVFYTPQKQHNTNANVPK